MRKAIGSVQVTALIALFVRMNFDMLIAIRTCPNQSWTNPAERVMSILNLALQNVSLERQEMDEAFERRLINKKNIKAVRSEIEFCPELKDKVSESLLSVINLLNGRFERMKLKDRRFKVTEAADEKEMESIFDEVLAIDASLTQNDHSRKALQKAPALQKFLETHCHSIHYAFQLKKCRLDSCVYCSAHPICMPLDQFDSFSYLPMPRLDVTGQHFKSFTDVYGQLPNEVDRPSLSRAIDDDDTELDKKNRKLLSSSGKVRMAIQCGECCKPRCVHSDARLTPEEKEKLCDLEDLYTCGSVLFPPASEYHSTIIVRATLSCEDAVEPQYYSTRVVNFPPVCSHCGSPEETLVEDEVVRHLKQRKQVVRPIIMFFNVVLRERSLILGVLVQIHQSEWNFRKKFVLTIFMLYHTT